MNSHIEKPFYLTFGKTVIDVSNVPFGREKIAARIWNEVREKPLNIRKKNKDETIKEYQDYTTKLKIKKVQEFNQMVDRVGLYLIKQPLNTLMFRYDFKTALKSFITRQILTIKKIEKGNSEQYEAFQDWIYETLTGEKKKRLEIKATVIDQIVNFYGEMESKYNISPEECKELLPTLVQGLRTQLKNYTPIQKESC